MENISLIIVGIIIMGIGVIIMIATQINNELTQYETRQKGDNIMKDYREEYQEAYAKLLFDLNINPKELPFTDDEKVIFDLLQKNPMEFILRVSPFNKDKTLELVEDMISVMQSVIVNTYREVKEEVENV